MKTLILSIAFGLLSFNTLACHEINRHRICPGQTVYPDLYSHPKGGKFLAINSKYKTMTVESHHTGGVEEFKFENISLRGCAKKLCAGLKVFPDSDYHPKGGKIIAANPFSGKITVESLHSGGVSRYLTRDLSSGTGCVGGVCVKDIVFPSDYTNTKGGRVIAINKEKKQITVESLHTGGIKRYHPASVSIIDYCLTYTSVQRSEK